MAIPTPPPTEALLEIFQNAAQRIPAYKTILTESGVCADDVKTIEDFHRLPILDKHSTFKRFRIHELSVDGKIGPLSWILTSSGHSGIFSFGLYDPPAAEAYKQRIDMALDAIFQVSTKSSMLLNVLPMGVKLYSEYCTLGETSVRDDMAYGLVEAFGEYHEQIIIIGEPGFVKHLLEVGARHGIDWKKHLVHLILGEEMVAENSRKYFEGILGTSPGNRETGLIGCSMGVAELGLNLFSEVPPLESIIHLRRALHDNDELRHQLIGDDVTTAPAVFAYDPGRIYVEFIDGRLVLTPLDLTRVIPLVRYTSDDEGGFLELSESVRPTLESMGIDYEELRDLPLVFIQGRGHFAKAGDERVYPEEVKEGIYYDPELAKLTTANFRIASGDPKAKVRVQLVSGVEPSDELTESFVQAICRYVKAPVDITCEAYHSFNSGMNVDYERKHDYLSE